MHPSYHKQFASAEDDDRRSRFVSTNPGGQPPHTLRERAASQPPRSDMAFPSSSPLLSGGSSPWSQRMALNLSQSRQAGVQPSASRSASFSAGPQGQFSNAMRDARTFESTFEDDESEVFSDIYDEPYIPMSRGRSYAHDPTRSRSQSLATSRPGPVGSPFQPHTTPGVSWQESTFNSNALNIPSSRYGEIKPPGSSRYGSLGTLGGASPILGNGFSRRQQVDPSNMSPFVRDVGQILLDEGSAFRELWAGMNPPRDENGGGGSGTTSRRHSVSVVQPRRGNIVGFNAPGSDDPDEPTRPFQSAGFGRGGLMLTEDDLASDLGLLNLNHDQALSQLPPSQPSSLPIYTPISRSPPSTDRVSPYQPMGSLIPSSRSPLASRQSTDSPGDSARDSDSPIQSQYEQITNQYFNPGTTPQQQHQQHQHQHQHQGQQPFARYIPGQGIQYLPPSALSYQRNRTPSYSSTGASAPLSPGARGINSQQPPYFPQQQMQRRPSEASQPSLNDLGKGVPLHAVPPSWPLYIVEFKAGRTDLFYLTDLSLDVRVGDLVIVEADRGKDLGKVVNDSITLAEVEAFQKQQQARAGMDEQPTSPGGTNAPPGKKEINPKQIYGKAQQQDTHLLITKMNDEVKALQLCQSKVIAKKLPMEVIDAEYQWDRRKLTFYFVAEKRIDFRELVRELFRLYKTRIWMASLQGPGGYEQ